MKSLALRLMRSKWLQPFWERLNHISLIGMNYFASTLEDTGELPAMAYARQKLGCTDCVIVDVGANAGQFARAALSIFNISHLYSCEPSKAAREQFNRNLGNCAGADRVTLLDCALGESKGSGILHAPVRGSALASLHQLRDPLIPFDDANSETVEIRTLDEVCDQFGITEIAYLKIDVEGHELAVLKGARRMLSEKRIRFVHFEFSDANIDSRTYLRDFFDILGDGWAIKRIVRDGLVDVKCYSPELERFACIYFLAERSGDAADPGCASAPRP